MSDAPQNGVLIDHHDAPNKPTINGDLNGHAHDGVSPDSPAANSPATPVNTAMAADIKIDTDYTERESDVRHEPIPVKLDTVEDASVLPQVGTPLDPATLPIEPPKGTPPPPTGQLLEDVRMAEEPLPSQGSDVHMADDAANSSAGAVVPNGHAHESPAATPMSTSLPAVPSSETAVQSHDASSPYPNNINSNNNDDDDKPPPAKRQRKHSDADRASVANTGTTPPASVSPAAADTPLPAQPPVSTISVPQWRFCMSTIRTLKKMKDAGPFLQPVDPIVLNIPHYPSIIKNPMDFSTVERKLQASSPVKPDSNPTNPRYFTADDFIADVRLIFANCVTFNGPDHAVSLMGKRVEAVFDKQIKQMPPPEEPKPVVKKVPTPPPPPPPAPIPAKKPVARRQSTSVPVIRRTDEQSGRPKREIHPPPPKDLPYLDVPKKARRVKAAKNDINAEQLRYCEKVLKDLHRKQHYNIAHPFYEPVDWVKLDIPSYPKVIKRPMDLSTMKKKLTNGEYSTAQAFYDDFKLMVRNCMTFNPAKNPVHEAGVALDRLFEEKWHQLPTPRSHDVSEDEDEDEDEDSDEERARMIATMESQIQSMKNNLDSLRKKTKLEKRKEKKEKPVKQAAPVASSSKAMPKQPKNASTSKKKGKKPVNDDDVLTFEQKKDLSDTIGKLDGTKLEKVIQIIHEGVPEIRDSTEEIELEIDQLPASVLTKLYNFVIRPIRAATVPKRSRTGKGTGTGGLKRKSMDEDVEAEKIRQLEARMKLFEEGGTLAAGEVNGITHTADDSEHSSAESSDSESSASDSE
ncbi:Bromodomain-containing protein [Obba rivulosa]|uniref:Bromodomain-containing protein n=1 Tax=Obba rivulosa TaxID=1052685 RepID=A0A8E2J794_9APHY|nr:Bromodomain-containing protein [Obba rivulosa]